MEKRTEGFMRAYADRLIETWVKDLQSIEVQSLLMVCYYNLFNY